MQLFGFDAEIEIKDNSLNFLQPVFEQWIKVHRDYIEQSKEGKNLYWFNERANLSALAGAIWRSGGFASEEYSAPKGDSGKMGRVDLHFIYSGREIICEAKHDWLYLPIQKSSKEYWSKVIEPSLNNAMEDAKHTKKANIADIVLGITFIVPYWDAKADSTKPPITKTDMKKQLTDLTERNCSFYAYLENQQTEPQKSKSGGEAYNSVILIGKIVS